MTQQSQEEQDRRFLEAVLTEQELLELLEEVIDVWDGDVPSDKLWGRMYLRYELHQLHGYTNKH